MTKEYSFEEYWEERVKSFDAITYRSWIIDAFREEAKKAWNAGSSSAQEEILEVNVIINKGIWKALNERDKNNGKV